MESDSSPLLRKNTELWLISIARINEILSFKGLKNSLIGKLDVQANIYFGRCILITD